MAKKRVIFEIETESENERIESYLKSWLIENFKIPESATIKIEDLE